MDDVTKHGDDELQDMDNDDLVDMDTDEGVNTPADTDDSSDDSDEPKSESADDVKERQKKAWIEKIREGKRSLDDMPENLGWLKKDVEKELSGEKGEEEQPKKQSQDEDAIEKRIRMALREERAEEDFNYLVDDMSNSDIDAEVGAQLQTRYEDILSEWSNPTYSQRLKALLWAREMVGLKDGQAIVKDRKRKGMTLPPTGNRKRQTVQKSKMTDIERRLSGDLPPGFKI